LEPAIWSKPIFFGPYTDHCAEIADLLLRAGGGRRAADHTELATQVAAVLHDRSVLERMGHAAQQVVLDNRGALERTVEVITRLLGSSVKSQQPHRAKTQCPVGQSMNDE